MPSKEIECVVTDVKLGDHLLAYWNGRWSPQNEMNFVVCRTWEHDSVAMVMDTGKYSAYTGPIRITNDPHMLVRVRREVAETFANPKLAAAFQEYIKEQLS